MKIKTVIIQLIIILGIVGAVAAQNIRIRLENCQLEQETLSKIQNSLNFQLQFYARIFNHSVDSSFKARIFGSETDFLKYSKTKANFNPIKSHSVAFFDHGLNEMILHKNVGDLAKVFAHELSHAILNYYCKNASTWIHEGLAELLEDIILVDSINYFGAAQIQKIGAAQTLFVQGVSIADVIESKNFYELTSQSKNYSISFAVTLYLYMAKEEILSNIVKGECIPKSDNFDFHYPEGLELLEIDVKSYFLNYRPSSE